MFKSLIKNIFHSISSPVNLNTFVRISNQNLFLPFYHIISDQAAPHVEELYEIRTTQTFKQDLSFLTTHYRAVSAQELYEKLKNKETFDKPSFHLTFDDGLKEMLTVVAPILKEFRVPATFFINSAFVDNKDLFYRYKVSLLIHHFKKTPPSPVVLKALRSTFSSYGLQKKKIADNLLAVKYSNKKVLDEVAQLAGISFDEYLQTHQPYLTTEDLLQLKKMGFTIGAHSIDHPNYKYLSLEEQLLQTKVSLDFIKTTFQLPYSYFSFPFSDEGVSKAFFDRIFNPYQPLLDISFGISGLKKDSFPNHLHRFPMEGNALRAEQLIKTEYLYYMAKSLFNKNTITRK